MNSVILIGRLTKDPQIAYNASQTAIARFALALDRGKDKDGNDKGADFPGCVAFGKTAEIIDKYAHKGDRLAVSGRIQTGSYEKDGKKIYTTDVIADRIELLTSKPNTATAEEKDNGEKTELAYTGFAPIDDIPF